MLSRRVLFSSEAAAELRKLPRREWFEVLDYLKAFERGWWDQNYLGKPLSGVFEDDSQWRVVTLGPRYLMLFRRLSPEEAKEQGAADAILVGKIQRATEESKSKL